MILDYLQPGDKFVTHVEKHTPTHGVIRVVMFPKNKVGLIACFTLENGRIEGFGRTHVVYKVTVPNRVRHFDLDEGEHNS